MHVITMQKPLPSTWRWVSVYLDGPGFVWLPDHEDQQLLEAARLLMVERGQLAR